MCVFPKVFQYFYAFLRKSFIHLRPYFCIYYKYLMNEACVCVAVFECVLMCLRMCTSVYMYVCVCMRYIGCV